MAMCRRRIAFALCFAAASGCSSERKLSHVEVRLPAATASGESSVTPLRARLAQQTAFPPSCPKDFREQLGALANERVKVPPCPGSIAPALEAVRSTLSLGEISAVEELLAAQCRWKLREGIPDGVDALMQEPTRGVHRTDEEMRLRSNLRAALLEMRDANAPLYQWMRNNGEYVFPDEQVDFFARLSGSDACRMPDQEVDQSYRTLRCLDDLVRIEPAGDDQRTRLERFLNGVHIVIDRKIQEFFR
jgi:hypothetical protein